MPNLKIGRLYKLGTGTARVVEPHPVVPGIFLAVINIPGFRLSGLHFMFYADGKPVDNFVHHLPDMGEEINEGVVESPAFQ
jgi:hypothetical protein